MPFFSVVIPLFNKEKHIKNTIKSVLGQTFANFELIIVNDGSTDGGLKKAQSINDNRIKIYSQKNSGAAVARNFGIEKANSEHIALLDADDVWEANHLAEHHKSILKFPEAALYCNAYNLKLAGNFTHKATYTLSEQNRICLVEDYFKASNVHPVAWTSAVVFKKKDFNEIGGFDPVVLSGQDIDLWLRFGLQKTIVFNPAVTTCYDKTIENSLSKGNFRESKYELFHSYLGEEKTNPSLKKYLDLNRYSVALHCKYHNDSLAFRKLREDIDPASLNFKQKLLLLSPGFLVRFLKGFHSFLIKQSIYLTAFRQN